MGIQERKEREKEARREEIVNAAQRVFLTRGLANATMDDIAREAELSKGTLYLYYRSKEELYVMLAARGVDILYSMLKQATSTDEPVLRLIVKLGETYWKFFEEHRDFFRTLYFFESPEFQTNVADEIKDLCMKNDDKAWRLVRDLIQRGIDEGMLHPGLKPMEVTMMLWSNTNGFLRLIDRNQAIWAEKLGVDLAATLHKSNMFLLEAMMTERAKRMFPDLVIHNDTQDISLKGQE